MSMTVSRMVRPKLTSAAVAALIITSAAAGPAAAVDGEVLITRAKVNAGDITPGDAAGFPATLSRPGRYKLGGNLTVPALMNGIEITASDVTIDLNGFTISSATAGQAASGIVALQGAGVLRVINGTISGFSGAGITKSPGRAVIEDMRILANTRNLELPADSQVRNSTIANGGDVGVRCYGTCLIENNIITGNAITGVSLEKGGGTVLGNVIVGNTFAGITSSDNPTGYGNNVLIGNSSGGAQVSGLVSPLHPNACVPACP
jgi:parallel beta-helix repeat protein